MLRSVFLVVSDRGVFSTVAGEINKGEFFFYMFLYICSFLLVLRTVYKTFLIYRRSVDHYGKNLKLKL